MIIDFTFSNYLSFGGDNTFSMTATKDKSRFNDNTYTYKDLVLLKSAAIYGANGSGKSNFVSAFTQMKSYVLETGSLENSVFKLSRNNSNKPTLYEVVFANNDKTYRYGFEVLEGKYITEWLFYKSSSRETSLFTRERQKITVNREFKEGRAFIENVKENRLFLAVVSELNGSISNDVTNWFKNIRVLSGLNLTHENTLALLSKNKAEVYKNKILSLLHSFDVQMEDFTVKEKKRTEIKIPENSSIPASLKTALSALEEYMKDENIKSPPYVVTHRRIFDDKKAGELVDFDLLDNESDGTKKLFSLAGLIVETLDKGLTLLIDELESKLHPLITKRIVNIFNSSTENKKNAQLIFTTHDTNLLNGGHLRRDQIWFTEKDRYGCTHLYSLAEYKQNIAREASVEEDYINGRFGAIPFIGNISKLLR